MFSYFRRDFSNRHSLEAPGRIPYTGDRKYIFEAPEREDEPETPEKLCALDEENERLITVEFAHNK